DFNIILDQYLVAGPAAKKQIAANRYCSVGKMDCIGLLRSDWLRGCDSEKRDRPQVLVLDYASPENWWEDTDPLVNRTANKAFYFDIIRLALERRGVDFLVRGKTAGWMSDAFFSDVVATIDRIPNLKVDRTYSEFNRSYGLAANADCIIAKHTSLGDE